MARTLHQGTALLVACSAATLTILAACVSRPEDSGTSLESEDPDAASPQRASDAPANEGGSDGCGLDGGTGSGRNGPWVRPSELPSGACDRPSCAVEIKVNTCCNDPDTAELAVYDCQCGAGGWACIFSYGGGGYCGDGSVGSYFGDESCAPD